MVGFSTDLLERFSSLSPLILLTHSTLNHSPHPWGISIKPNPGNYRYFGYFSQDRKEIVPATKEETVLFHELAHAAHQRILGELKHGQDWKQEIVAELAASSYARWSGRPPGIRGIAIGTSKDMPRVPI